MLAKSVHSCRFCICPSSNLENQAPSPRRCRFCGICIGKSMIMAFIWANSATLVVRLLPKSVNKPFWQIGWLPRNHSPARSRWDIPASSRQFWKCGESEDKMSSKQLRCGYGKWRPNGIWLRMVRGNLVAMVMMPYYYGKWYLNYSKSVYRK